MDPISILAGLASAGSIASSVGGFFGGGDQGLSRDDQRYLAHQQVGMSLRNEQFQHDLAEHGISMRVKDAEAAGLHPLAALGMSPSNGSFGMSVPVSSGSGAGGFRDQMSNMGQDLSRAAAAAAGRENRQALALELRNRELQNELLSEQVANARWENMRQVGPPNPADAKPAFVYQTNADGTISRQPSESWALANSNSLMARLEWMYNNKLMPGSGSGKFGGIKMPKGRVGYSSGR